MAYDVNLERRVDLVIARWGLKFTKKKMFGGLAYMHKGNMAFGVMKQELLVRVSGPSGMVLISKPGIRHFHMGTMQSMDGWYLAGDEAIKGDVHLRLLLSDSRDYVLTLPAKDK